MVSPKETVTTIMMLYKNTKTMVHKPDGDTDFFDSVAGVLQGDILAPYTFITYIDYILWLWIDQIKENSFTLKKTRSRSYSTETMTDADCADDLALFAYAPA